MEGVDQATWRVLGRAVGPQVRHHLAAERFGAGEARLDHALIGVEHGDRRDGDHDADRGCDQRLADLAHQARGDLARRFVQLGERADDADDRAEQSDERRVGAQRAQEREPPLHPDLRHVRRARDSLFGGGGAVFRIGQARRGHLGLDRLGRRQPVARRIDVADAQEREHVALETAVVVAGANQVDGPIERDGDTADREPDQNPHHPGGPQHRETRQLGLNVHGRLSLFVVRCAALRPAYSAGTVPAKTDVISRAVRRTATNGHRVSGAARTTVRALCPLAPRSGERVGERGRARRQLRNRRVVTAPSLHLIRHPFRRAAPDDLD